MVEEMIAEGKSPAEIVGLLVTQFGLDEGDAWLTVNTAQGLPGDDLEVVEDAEWEDDVEDDDADAASLAASVLFDETKHPRFEAGRREGGRFAPKAGTSTAAVQAEAEQAVADADGTAKALRQQRWELIRGNPYELGRLTGPELADYIQWAQDDVAAAYSDLPVNPVAADMEANAAKLEDYYLRNSHLEAARLVETQRASDEAYLKRLGEEAVQPGAVGKVRRMGIASTNPVYMGELDGGTVVVKPEAQLTPTTLRTWIEPGYDLEREQAAAHVASLLAQDTPEVDVRAPAYRVMDVQGYGRSGVADYVEGETLANAYRLSDRQRSKYDGPPLGKWGNDLENVRMFDGIIGNTDRHEGNLMIDPAGRIHAIDHGLSFPSENQESWSNLQGGSSEVPLTDAQRGALERLRPKITTNDPVLAGLLTEQQLRRTQERIDFMLKHDRLPKQTDWQEGWNA